MCIYLYGAHRMQHSLELFSKLGPEWRPNKQTNRNSSAVAQQHFSSHAFEWSCWQLGSSALRAVDAAMIIIVAAKKCICYSHRKGEREGERGQTRVHATANEIRKVLKRNNDNRIWWKKNHLFICKLSRLLGSLLCNYILNDAEREKKWFDSISFRALAPSPHHAKSRLVDRALQWWLLVVHIFCLSSRATPFEYTNILRLILLLFSFKWKAHNLIGQQRAKYASGVAIVAVAASTLGLNSHFSNQW